MDDLAQLRELDRLLTEALARPAPERAAWIAAAVPEELRPRLERMIAAAEDEDDTIFEAGALGGSLGERIAAGGRLVPGSRVGPFRVLSLLGHGGMGEVYLAERADGNYEQRVALKVAMVRHPDDDRARRFEKERRILASLEHPAIARILDAGTTEEGFPSLAMELVEGSDIVSHCDERRLDLEARLRLFVRAGRAVEAAHRQLVVHRDLKPSNVMVTRDGEPKLLDFGIAAFLEEETGSTPATTPWMTAEYASPEQFLGGPVGTASDVYQLGLLLYVLLAGELPYSLRGQPPSRIEEILCRLPATPPSERVGVRAKAGEAAEAAARRGLTPRRWRRSLAGDLDLIVLTALRKEPERRYGTVEGFLDDIERYLEGLPVAARPDSLGYRARRFLGRHRWAVAAAAATLVAFLVVTAAYAGRLRSQRMAAEQAAARAEEISWFLRQLFEAADPYRRSAAEPSLREILDRGAARIGDELGAAPEVREEMLLVLARAYLGLGSWNDADELLRQAYESRRERLGPTAPELAPIWTERSRLERRRERPEGAWLAARQAVVLQERADAATRGRARLDLALALRSLHRNDEALATLAEARLLLDPLLASDDPLRRDLEHDRGTLYFNASRHPEAVEAFERALAAIAGQPERELERLATLRVLAGSLYYLGRPAAAENALREVIAIDRRRLGPENPETLTASCNLATVLADLGRFDDAVSIARSVLAIAPAGDEGAPLRVRAALPLGLALLGSGRPADALPVLEEGTRLAISLWGGYGSARYLMHLGDVHWAAGDPTAAEAAWDAAREALEVEGPEGLNTVEVDRRRAAARLAQGDVTGARRMLEHLRRTDARILPREHFERGEIALLFAALARRAGDRNGLDREIRETRRVADALRDHPRAAEDLRRRADLLRRGGDPSLSPR